MAPGTAVFHMVIVWGKVVSEQVFAEGWLDKQGKAAGRPVDILELADGSLLVSDDLAGVIYKISYTGVQ